jgi:hypothetical protein
LKLLQEKMKCKLTPSTTQYLSIESMMVPDFWEHNSFEWLALSLFSIGLVCVI